MKRIPIPGQRIVRSVLASLMCIAFYYLRGRRGAPFYTFECREGEVILRIYSCEATRRNMMKQLQEILGAPRTVLFGNIPGECDVLIPDAGGGYMAKELKKRFEPGSLAGWRSMIHL